MPVSVLGRVPVNRGDILPVSGSLLPATAGLQFWLRADMGTTLNDTVLTAPNDFSDAAWSKAACSAVAMRPPIRRRQQRVEPDQNAANTL
jgi:hypothetical protein